MERKSSQRFKMEPASAPVRQPMSLRKSLSYMLEGEMEEELKGCNQSTVATIKKGRPEKLSKNEGDESVQIQESEVLQALSKLPKRSGSSEDLTAMSSSTHQRETSKRGLTREPSKRGLMREPSKRGLTRKPSIRGMMKDSSVRGGLGRSMSRHSSLSRATSKRNDEFRAMMGSAGAAGSTPDSAPRKLVRKSSHLSTEGEDGFQITTTADVLETGIITESQLRQLQAAGYEVIIK